MEVEPEVIDCMNDMLRIVVKKEKQRLRHKQYYEKNKQQISQQQKQRYEENKEQISQRYKEYYNQNKEQISQQQKQYNKTPERVKARRIKDWKRLGVICDDMDGLYEHYIKTTHCDECEVELTYDTITTATTKCLDHCHETGMFRNILCHSCNIKRR